MIVTIDRRIQCRVCERNERPHPEHSLLCIHCGADLPAARALLTSTLEAARRGCDFAWMELERAIPEGADPPHPLYVRWCAFQDAYTRQDAAAIKAMQAARNGMQGPLADLIRLWCNHLDAQRAYTARQLWAHRADLALLLCEPATADQGELPL